MKTNITTYHPPKKKYVHTLTILENVSRNVTLCELGAFGRCTLEYRTTFRVVITI